ncbi:MAG: serine/threonine protein kinase [Gemmatimonadetes bacterium]|nr:serine/threonine protein kinase [Gemmatimonadota bacterium]
MSARDLREELQHALHDEYTIERELPRGGMSRVFVAMERALHRHVVIKVLSPELAASLSAERFKREITWAARLQHPHIVPLLSAGLAGKHLFYTMPLVDGESLRDRMNRERPMAFADIARITEDVAGALAYAHEEGVVHRDIKPENIMFFHGRAVVLDFGIGKALLDSTTAETEMLRITQAGMSLGTPMYVAPEQARGDAELDHRADLYALGVVAYELITGHPPFTGKQPAAIFEAHAKKVPEPIKLRRPDTPSSLATIVMRCLEKQPDDRPRTGADIVRALAPASAAPVARGSTVGGRAGWQLPAWLPWVVAGITSVVAVVLAILYAQAR